MSSDSVHCSVRWILLLLEELKNKNCAVHMNSRMVTYERNPKGAIGTYDCATLLKGSVNYTNLKVMNLKKYDYSSLPISLHNIFCAKLALGYH